jgi:CMP-N-acetylneuraminic acid synthetase
VTSILALVPARGGSKGIPGKNVRLLGGVPLIGWTAAAIRSAAVPGLVAWLSTDDPVIAEVGRQCGLQVPWLRPTELATDTASSLDVCLHALDTWRNEQGADPDLLVLLQPTSPFRRAERIAELVERMAAADAPAAAVTTLPILRTPATLFAADAGGILTPLASGDGVQRRQDVRALQTPDGGGYAIRPNVLRTARSFFAGPLAGVATTPLEQIDLDTPEDWQIAEALLAAGLVAAPAGWAV